MSSDPHAHPTPSQYWRIAAVLAVLTAIEVGIFYLDRAFSLGAINALVLVGLSSLKFVLVVGFFMHLRYEKSSLSRLFTAGFVLAVGLYLIVLASFGVVALRGG